jgi:hypothetical protein
VAAEPLQVIGDFPERQLEVHALLGTERGRIEARARHRAEPLPELVQPVAPDGETRGHPVPAEAIQQIGAFDQRVAG